MDMRAFFAIIYTRQLKSRANARNISTDTDVKCRLARKIVAFVTGPEVERLVEIEYYIL
jgi:hypothetical protein